MRLSVDGIVKRYGAVAVLEGVSLDAPPGEVTGLIGPNGSGKSTLFDVITRFLPADEGRVTLDGRSILHLSPDALARQGLVRTFQIPRVARRMTVIENMMVAPFFAKGEGDSRVRQFSPRKIQALRREEATRREEAWLTLKSLELDDLANEFAEVLSGGQMKLLSLGMAAMIDPATLLLDEPAAGVNSRLFTRIRDLIATRRARGLTTLLIEHNIDMVTELCDSVYVLDAGRVIAHGRPAEIQRTPAVIDAYLGRRQRAMT